MDFSVLPTRHKTYAGANGSKISVDWNGEIYMLKFPAVPSVNKAMSYTNGCLSEYLGSHIFNMCGVEAQETELGTYTKDGRTKIVVACKDFTSPETVLQDFASLKNTIIDSGHNGYGTELSDILMAIDAQQAVDPFVLKAHFWDMFIVDAFIGNWDRHNGNWGFLYNLRTDTMEIAPVYDCGSCLYPQADLTLIRSVLDDPSERNSRVYQVPTSSIKQDGQKINYFDFLYGLSNDDCNAALKRIVPRIDMRAINELIDSTPYISDLQKQFYQTMLAERKEKILDAALDKLVNRERGFAEIVSSGSEQADADDWLR